MANQTIRPGDQRLLQPGINSFGVDRDSIRSSSVDLVWRCVCLYDNHEWDIPAGQLDGYQTSCQSPKGCREPAYFEL